MPRMISNRSERMTKDKWECWYKAWHLQYPVGSNLTPESMMALDRRANLRIFFPFSRTSYMILPSSSLIFHPPLLYSSNNVSIFVTTSWIAFVIQDSPCPPCSFKTDWLSLSRLLSASCHKLRGELSISVAVGWRADGMMGFEPWVEASRDCHPVVLQIGPWGLLPRPWVANHEQTQHRCIHMAVHPRLRNKVNLPKY